MLDLEIVDPGITGKKGFTLTLDQNKFKIARAGGWLNAVSKRDFFSVNPNNTAEETNGIFPNAKKHLRGLQWKLLEEFLAQPNLSLTLMTNDKIQIYGKEQANSCILYRYGPVRATFLLSRNKGLIVVSLYTDGLPKNIWEITYKRTVAKDNKKYKFKP